MQSSVHPSGPEYKRGRTTLAFVLAAPAQLPTVVAINGGDGSRGLSARTDDQNRPGLGATKL